MKNSVAKINLKKFLLSFFLNPGAVLIGLSIYGILLDKKPFASILAGEWTNAILLGLGVFFAFNKRFHDLQIGQPGKNFEA